MHSRGGASWAAVGDGAVREALHRSGRKGSCGDKHAVPSAGGHRAGRCCICACVHLRVRAPAGRLTQPGPSPRLVSHSVLSVVLCEGQQCVVRNVT